MKKLLRKLASAKKVEKTLHKNILVGPQVLQNIKRWETQSGGDIIRSSFNRELYYKLLSLKK